MVKLDKNGNDTYDVVEGNSSLYLPVNGLHVVTHENILAMALLIHLLQSHNEAAVSPIFVKTEKVHYIFAKWILEHSLSRKSNTIWQIKVSRDLKFVAHLSELHLMDILWFLIRISSTVIDSRHIFKRATLFVGKFPVTAKLPLVSEWEH